MNYYKDRSADWWKKNGIAGYVVSVLFSVGAVLLLCRTGSEEFARYPRQFELTLMYIFLSFGTVILQMIMQRFGRNGFRNALFAAQGEIGADRVKLVKYDAIMWWAWAADLAVYMIIYGAIFADDLVFVACGLPPVGVIFIFMLVHACVRTADGKKPGSLCKGGEERIKAEQ